MPLGSVWLFYVACLFSLALAPLSFGDPCTEATSALAPPHLLSLSFRTETDQFIRVSSAVPDWSPRDELLVAINFHHPSLYFGDYYWDWTSLEYVVKKRRMAIAAGVILQIKIGEERVRQLAGSTDRKDYEGICWGTCEHRTLWLLQKNGIVLSDDIPLSSESFLRAAVFSGFRDEKGPLLQRVHVFHKPGTLASIEPVLVALRRHEVDNFLLFLSVYGFQPQTFLQELSQVTSDPELLQIPAHYENGTIKIPLTARQNSYVARWIAHAESLLKNEIRSRAGTTQAALDYVSTNPFPAQLASDVVSGVIRQALREVR